MSAKQQPKISGCPAGHNRQPGCECIPATASTQAVTPQLQHSHPAGTRLHHRGEGQQQLSSAPADSPKFDMCVFVAQEDSSSSRFKLKIFRGTANYICVCWRSIIPWGLETVPVHSKSWKPPASCLQFGGLFLLVNSKEVPFQLRGIL